jgi:hypothetical protein
LDFLFRFVENKPSGGWDFHLDVKGWGTTCWVRSVYLSNALSTILIWMFKFAEDFVWKMCSFWNWAMQLVLIAKTSRGRQQKKTSRDVWQKRFWKLHMF